MGEKVYRPVLKDGDHLIPSKDNPNRVRGLTRDENNQNPGIPEWEVCDPDDFRSDNSKVRSVQLAPEEEDPVRQAGEALGAAIVGILFFRKVISPWWKNSAWPWFKEKGHNIKNAVNGKKEQKSTKTAKEKESDRQFAEVSSQIDKVFAQPYFEMDEEEVKDHMMRLVYHMLGVVNEIRIISNARIKKDCASKELCIERQKEVEKFLSAKVADEFNGILSDGNLRLDLNTSKELFSLTGGGVRLNGEYIPVQADKIEIALKELNRKGCDWIT